ncbi:MAG: PLP-dependent aminotransferase family protein [bacterium]|nr:MAG: PLP-dependent aminotransferase family protein [bacterium]
MDKKDDLFSRRALRVPRSFIREILKVAGQPDVISFAGGLPHPGLFPLKELGAAMERILEERGPESFQYGPSEGFGPLREWVCQRYRRRMGLDITPENVLITTGSQQALDLVGKVLLNDGDFAAMERPGYLGAIQAFAFHSEAILQVPLAADGPDIKFLEAAFRQNRPRIFYAIPNFQNPSGLTYSLEKRKRVAELCRRYKVFLVEDDPYGELRFAGSDLPPVASFMEDGCMMLGTFSKTVAPGLRVGWILAGETVLERLLVAKQAADLHTSTLSQHLVWQYLTMYDLDEHIAAIRKVYGRQRDGMIQAIRRTFPPEVMVTEPDGGMFLWVTLPEGCSTLELFERAIKEKVAFVPGAPFYVDGGGVNTMRLNFSNADIPDIDEGIKRLGHCLDRYLSTLA